MQAKAARCRKDCKPEEHINGEAQQVLGRPLLGVASWVGFFLARISDAAVNPAVRTFDSATRRFYPKEHDSSRLRHVLLSTGAGVRVKNQRDSYQPTR